MADISEADALRAEIAQLRSLVLQRNAELCRALGALSSMWNQYCPPPWTHESMNSGEDTEEVLEHWKLKRQDETSIQIYGAQIDADIPDEVLALLPASAGDR